MQIESSAVSIQQVAKYHGINGKQLEHNYKHHISDYHTWEQLPHADDYVIFKQNIGERLSMDETCLSQGELYTIITNKSAHGGKGALVAMIKFAHWYEKVERMGCKFFNSVIDTMQNNYATIVNYFENRSTNASAESWNT